MLPRHCRTCTNAAPPTNHLVLFLSAKRGVPHISLVFREMWDAANLNLFPNPGVRVVRVAKHRDLLFRAYRPKVPRRAPVSFPGWR
jgi:hypothetical protein